MVDCIIVQFVLVYIVSQQAHLDAIRDNTACFEAGQYRTNVGARFTLEQPIEAHEAQDSGTRRRQDSDRHPLAAQHERNYPYMAAYVAVDISIRDPSAMEPCLFAVLLLVSKHGGKYLVRGPSISWEGDMRAFFRELCS